MLQISRFRSRCQMCVLTSGKSNREVISSTTYLRGSFMIRILFSMIQCGEAPDRPSLENLGASELLHR